MFGFVCFFVCSALFQSLLFEACGRTVNPVNGAVGMLWTGNWHVCQAAVETVLRGGTLRPMSDLLESPSLNSSDESTEIWRKQRPGGSRNDENGRNHHYSRSKLTTTGIKESPVNHKRSKTERSDLELNHGLALTGPVVPAPFLPPPPFGKAVNSDHPGSPSEESVTTSCYENGFSGSDGYKNKREKKLLNLFV